MAWRGNLSRNLKEIRILCCQTSPASAEARAFVEKNYKVLKSLNPKFPILIRECSGVEPQIWARYGLSYDTNEPVLKDAFEQHGEIIEVKVICHHVSGKSKGYGFVKFTSEDAASKALKEMDGQLVDGRNLRVHYAHKE